MGEAHAPGNGAELVDVKGNLAAVRQRIVRACLDAGRIPEDVTLLAVTKFQVVEHVRQAVEAGHHDFGENYAQELRDKALALPEARWHAIGPLQRNKAKYVAKAAWAFHALDRPDIAAELGRRREGAPLRCYLEVNIGRESSKSGVDPEGLAALYASVRDIAGITIVGLMCMPPPDDDPRPHFLALAALGRELALPRLSMGTTEDFEIAIACGATDVRVGRAIFGERTG